MNLFISFFFFKQKTAYDMRIIAWSSDVCSSDLLLPVRRDPDVTGMGRGAPGQTEQGCGIAGHRSGRMDEMGMQPAILCRQFGGQHQGLAKAATAVGRQVTAQVTPPALPDLAIRSEERRVGKECVSPCRCGGSRYP